MAKLRFDVALIRWLLTFVSKPVQYLRDSPGSGLSRNFRKLPLVPTYFFPRNWKLTSSLFLLNPWRLIMEAQVATVMIQAG